jgi:signal transduction histidine kinase
MRFVSRTGGRIVILALGGLYVALAIGRALLRSIEGTTIGIVFSNSVLIVLPGLVLLYFGYRLPRANVKPELYPAIASWCLAGASVMLSVLAFIEFRPDGHLERPFYTVQLATALGCVGGLGIGIHDARAKTRAREAEQSSRELERQNERLESFAGMLAHELRNPLNIAQIYHQHEQPGNEDAAEQVEGALDRIEEMIDVLLVTVRASDANVATEPVALAAVAHEAWTDVSTGLSGGQTTDSDDSTGTVSDDSTGAASGDSTDAVPDEPSEATGDAHPKATLDVGTDQTIVADPVHVEHLLRNLFRNSFEHRGDDTDHNLTVRIGDLPSGFYVADDGPGIAEDVREDVVEAGFTTKTDGIGLGLTFVAQLAEMYDWEYAITESESGGARFEFRNVERASAAADLQRH